MKVKFTLLTLVLTAAVSSAMASGTQPGRWRWKRADAPVSGSLTSSQTLAAETTPITIKTAYDVVSLRWQVYSGSVSYSLFTTGRLFLQYLDAGLVSITQPPAAQRTNDNDASTTFNKFSSDAQQSGWRTIADAGVTFAGKEVPTGDAATTNSNAMPATNAAFVMSSSSAAVSDQTTNYGTSDGGRMQMSYATSGYYTNAAIWNYYAYGIYTTVNGNSADIALPAGTTTTRVLFEGEFHIKSALNNSNSGNQRFGLKAGHRYFFRLRGWSPNSIAGYSSPDGSGNSTPPGDYKATPAFAYLDVANDFVPATLPVTLTSFNANLNGGKVNLAWATATEIANSGFEILKGINSNNLDQSKFVASKAASNGGNSSTALNYTSTDSFPVNNATNYYQLKQIDLDGNTSYSDKVSVYVTGATTSLTVGPNPAVSVLNVNNLKTGSNLRVISLSGAVVKSQIVNANSVSLDIANLPSGVYIVEVVNLGGIKESHKFVKK